MEWKEDVTLSTEVTLPEMLNGVARRLPERPALVAGSVRWTYRELAEQVDATAAALADLGVRRGDVVGLLAPNVAEWITIALGALSLGARVDAFNTWVKAYDLDQLLASSGASLLVMAGRVRRSDLLAELLVLLPELAVHAVGQWHSERYPALRNVVVLGDTAPSGADRWQDLLGRASAAGHVIPDESRPSDAAFVLYTSGSTTNPKGVPLCHRDLVINGFYIGERMQLSEQDRVWFGSPLFWSYGCANALMATMTHGACFVLQEQFSAESAAELMTAERVTAAYVLPTMIHALCSAADGAIAGRIRALGTIRTGATIGRPEEIQRAIDVLGIDGICNVYGSTETYGNCCVTPREWPGARRLSSQGPPLPGVELRVVDEETGVELPIGAPGELQVRGRITPGYLDDDEASGSAFTPDGWFRSGDRMCIGEDGAVSFIGRITDMIKTSGINVSPAEVETFLGGHPDVAEVLVLGAPHPTREQDVVAFVVPRVDSLTEEELLSFCRDRIAAYKVPTAVAIVYELPRTGTGKLRRRDLAADALALVQERAGL